MALPTPSLKDRPSSASPHRWRQSRGGGVLASSELEVADASSAPAFDGTATARNTRAARLGIRVIETTNEMSTAALTATAMSRKS